MSHSARWFTEKLEEFTGGNKSEQIHMNQTVIYNFINLPPDVVLESTKWTNNGPKTIEQVHLITILVGPSFSISSELTIKQSNLSKLVYVGYVGNHDPTCSPFFSYLCLFRNGWQTMNNHPIPPFPTWMCIPQIASVVYDPYTGWWFGTRFIFPYIGNNNPNWLIFFRGVETTNQYNIS